MKQLLVDETWESGKIFSLTGKAFRYLAKVRRVVAGESFSLLTKDGKSVLAKVLQVSADGNEIILQMEELSDFYKSENFLPNNIICCLALLKGTKSDESIRNSVQCGASEINIIKTEHSVFDIEKKSQTKIERWQRVAKEASQQSGNPHLIKINFFNSIDEFILSNKKSLEQNKLLVFHERHEGQSSLHEQIKNLGEQDIFIFVGPEGGFSTSEIEKLTKIGADLIWLGPNVLRAENATTAAISATNLLLLEREKWQ